jgi:Cadherin-like domain/Bacterial Ig domain/Calx-beta domain
MRMKPHAASRSLRTRLEMIALEDRTVPATATVSIGIISDTAENGADGLFEFARTGSTSAALTVNITVGGTATNGTDYTAIGSTITFAAGSSTADLSVVPLADNLVEGNETVTVELASGAGYTFAPPLTTPTVNIADDPPVITVAALNDAVEGGTDGVLEFSRTGGDVSSSLTATYIVSGTATSGTDYTSIGTTVTFAAHSAVADVNVAAPDIGISGSDKTVVATVTSGSGYTVGSPSSATADVVDADIPPAAFDNYATTSVNAPVTLSVLDLSSDPDGDTLTVSAITQGTNGTVVNNGDGTVTYTPGSNFTGDDSFTYTVEDPFGNTSTGTVTVTVTAPQAPPTSLWTATNTAVDVTVLDMAFDPDGETLAVSAITQGTHGSVVNSSGTLTYTPDTGFTGQDSFTYTVEDPEGNTATNTITVTVGPTNPIAADDDAATPVNTAVNVVVIDLAFQPAGGTLTTTAVTQGTHGSVVINMDGTVTYTPTSGYSGTDTFTYTVTDGSSNTATGSITVTVGTPATTDLDTITTALDGISADITGYVSGSTATIATAVSGITPTINTYVTDVMSDISANNLAAVGTNKSFSEFVPGVFTAFKRGLYPDYVNLLTLENLLWNLSVANKTKMDSIAAQRLTELKKPVPNGALIDQLTLEHTQLGVIQGGLIELRGKVENQMRNKAWIAATNAWLAMTAGWPAWGVKLLAPPNPPFRFAGDIIPN